MSPLLLASYGRRSVRPAPTPPGFQSLAAVYRTWGTPTDDTARFTIPLAPNHGYTTDDVRVFVDGTERAIHIEELRGRHNNGSGGDGGARAFFVELDATGFVDDTAAEIRLGDGARVPTDLSASGRGSMAMLRTHVENPRVVLCTDADYLCGTWATFHPLVTDANKHADDLAWAVTRRDELIAIRTPTDAGTGNWYDIGWSCFAWWCESGNPDYWWYANRFARARLTYNSPPNTGAHSTTVHLNPEGIAGSVVNGPSEVWSLVSREQSTAYLTTGYGQYWRNMNGQCIQKIGSNSWNTVETTLFGTGGGRRNMGVSALPVIYGYLLDCTYIMPTGDYAGGFPRRTPTWTTDLPRLLDAIDDTVNSAGNGDLEGYRGVRETTDPTGELGNIPCSIGDQQMFQASIPPLALIDWYLNVSADARLIGWIRTNLDIFLRNLQLNATTGLWAANYMLTRYDGLYRGAIESPWDGGNFYHYDQSNWLLSSYTTTTLTLPAGASYADDEINGLTVVIQSSAGAGAYSIRTVTDYVASTRVVTLDTSVSLTGTQRCLFLTTTAPGSTISSFANAGDWRRVVEFIAALYPTDSVNGKTYSEWRAIFRTQMTASESGYSGEWPQSPSSGSTFGRWWPTHGCSFAVNGVPAGPSALREPIVYESA